MKKLFLSILRRFSRSDVSNINQVQKRSYIEDMAVPRENFRSQYGGYNPKWFGSAILIVLLIGMFVFQGCKVKEIPVEYKTEYRYVDSVRLKDSVVIIPTERIVDIVPWYDTLHLESSISYSDAWIDTNYHIIQGQLVNKKGQLVEVKYVDRWKVRDSIVEKEIPIYIKGDTVTVTKRPWWSWICLTWSVICLGYAAWKLYKKFL